MLSVTQERRRRFLFLLEQKELMSQKWDVALVSRHVASPYLHKTRRSSCTDSFRDCCDRLPSQSFSDKSFFLKTIGVMFISFLVHRISACVSSLFQRRILYENTNIIHNGAPRVLERTHILQTGSFTLLNWKKFNVWPWNSSLSKVQKCELLILFALLVVFRARRFLNNAQGIFGVFSRFGFSRNHYTTRSAQHAPPPGLTSNWRPKMRQHLPLGRAPRYEKIHPPFERFVVFLWAPTFNMWLFVGEHLCEWICGQLTFHTARDTSSARKT